MRGRQLTVPVKRALIWKTNLSNLPHRERARARACMAVCSGEIWRGRPARTCRLPFVRLCGRTRRPLVGLSRRDAHKSFGSREDSMALTPLPLVLPNVRSPRCFSPFVLSAALSQLSIFARNQLKWRGVIRLTSRQKGAFSRVSSPRRTINAPPSSNASIRKLCGTRQWHVNDPSRRRDDVL